MVIPVEYSRNINAHLVVAGPANIVEQIIVSGETEAGAAVKAITLVGFIIDAGLVFELRTDTAAHGEVQSAQRIARLRILFKQSNFSLAGKGRSRH